MESHITCWLADKLFLLAEAVTRCQVSGRLGFRRCWLHSCSLLPFGLGCPILPLEGTQVRPRCTTETFRSGSRLTRSNCKYNTTDLLIPGGEYSKQYTRDELTDYSSAASFARNLLRFNQFRSEVQSKTSSTLGPALTGHPDYEVPARCLFFPKKMKFSISSPSSSP